MILAGCSAPTPEGNDSKLAEEITCRFVRNGTSQYYGVRISPNSICIDDNCWAIEEKTRTARIKKRDYNKLCRLLEQINDAGLTDNGEWYDGGLIVIKTDTGYRTVHFVDIKKFPPLEEFTDLIFEISPVEFRL